MSTERINLVSAGTECTIRVGIVPLRAALLSVVKHADTPKIGDEELALARVRWVAGQDELKPLVTASGILSRFDAAAKVYGLELVAEPTGTAESAGWVVYCGPDFAGVVESGLGGGSLGKRDKRKMRHLERAGLGKPALVSL